MRYIRQCVRPNCRFRFPETTQHPIYDRCPKCGSPTQRVELPSPNLKPPSTTYRPPGPEVEVLLDNLRSAFNVGSIFRSADGAGVRHLYLCGITPTPGNLKISKTALGAEHTMPWTQHWDSFEVIRQSKKSGLRLWALEGGSGSVSLFNCLSKLPGEPILLVVGNEVSGVDSGILKICDQVVYLPMAGIKDSLNVSIAFGIAVYTIRYHISNPFPPDSTIP